MIFGVGSDIVDIKRIHDILIRQGERFLNRVFTEDETAYALAKLRPAGTLANRFAAKEAVFKAIGTGKALGFSWKDVAIINDSLGKPSVVLKGKAKTYLDKKLGSYTIHLSLSHSDHLAQAFAVIEKTHA